MTESITVAAFLPVSPEKLYQDWLNSDEHSRFTGLKAMIDAREGGYFSSLDGYIHGKITRLEPNRRIIETWRTEDFEPDDLDSKVEIVFGQVPGGTFLTILQSEIPDARGEDIEIGWEDHYFDPMTGYYTPREG
jgi:activator of HSP90 ATPase